MFFNKVALNREDEEVANKGTESPYNGYLYFTKLTSFTAENYDFTPDDEKVALLWAVLASYLPSGMLYLLYYHAKVRQKADCFGSALIR